MTYVTVTPRFRHIPESLCVGLGYINAQTNTSIVLQRIGYLM